MQAVTTIGLGIAKSAFQVHGIDAAGRVVIRHRLPENSSLKARKRSGASVVLNQRLAGHDPNAVEDRGHHGRPARRCRNSRMGALYVLRSHQRRGVGRVLFTRLLATLRERGIAEACFYVVAINDKAIPFYRAHGAYPIDISINWDARGDTEDLVFAVSTDPGAALRGAPA
jgi:GNAT superfamily N-acetyltransferase